MKRDASLTNQPKRWRDGGGDVHALENRAALLVAAASSEPGIDAEVLARIHAAVANRRRRERVSASPRRALVVRLALAGLVLVASIASARGAVFLWRRYVAPAPVAPASPAVPPVRAAHVKRWVATAPAAAPAAVEPAPPQTIASPIAHPPRVVAALAHKDEPLPARATSIAAEAPAPHTADTPAPSPLAPNQVTAAPPEPAAGSNAGSTRMAAPPPFAAPPETEAHLLAQALSSLRQGKDPRAALATLDRYARLFPRGVLEDEALRTRVEATMALPDARAALVLLDGRTSFRGTLGADLLIARAELRANAGRCADARGDFAQVLAGAPARDVEERASSAKRSACSAWGWVGARAEEDIAAYRRRFPHGRFSSEIERLSSGSGGARRP